MLKVFNWSNGYAVEVKSFSHKTTRLYIDILPSWILFEFLLQQQDNRLRVFPNKKYIILGELCPSDGIPDIEKGSER